MAPARSSERQTRQVPSSQVRSWGFRRTRICTQGATSLGRLLIAKPAAIVVCAAGFSSANEFRPLKEDDRVHPSTGFQEHTLMRILVALAVVRLAAQPSPNARMQED